VTTVDNVGPLLFLIYINDLMECCDESYIYVFADNAKKLEAAVERPDKVKDLGVWFDEKLLSREHIQDKINKAYMMLGIIKWNYGHLTLPTFILYKTMVRSYLDYCCCVWAPYKKGEIAALEKVQKRATKILPSLRHLKSSSSSIYSPMRDRNLT